MNENPLDRDTPEVSKELIDYLYKIFNYNPPSENETLDQLRVRSGEQKVIQHLQYIHNLQYQESCASSPRPKPQQHHRQPTLLQSLKRLRKPQSQK